VNDSAKNRDNPDFSDEGDKGLGVETDAEPGGPDDVTRLAPDRRGEVKYPDVENPDEHRPDVVPQEGRVELDPDRKTDSSSDSQ
jgi:hypothetical protein